MFDNYSEVQIDSLSPIEFNPKRFELWMGGQLKNSGSVNEIITIITKSVSGLNQISVSFRKSIEDIENEATTSFVNKIFGRKDEHQNLREFIDSHIEFDVIFTSSDRLMICKIPSHSNCENVVGLSVLKANNKHTRNDYNFSSTDPFVCSLFTINGGLVKITFSFNNPEKLLEFYL